MTSSSTTKTVSDYCRPSYDFAVRLGLSTSVRGWVIFNAKNWGKLESFLRVNTKGVRGTYFDGMIDGQSDANRTIEQSIECAKKIFTTKRYGNGFNYYPDNNEVSIYDCCDSVRFLLQS